MGPACRVPGGDFLAGQRLGGVGADLFAQPLSIGVGQPEAGLSVITTNSAPVRLRAPSAAARGRLAVRPAGGVPGSALIGRHLGPHGRVGGHGAGQRQGLVLGLPAQPSKVSQAWTAALSSTTRTTTPNCSSRVWVENRSGGRGAVTRHGPPFLR